MPTVGGNDSPSGVGRGPVGMAWNIGLFSTFSSSRGSPNPALAQLTFDSTFLSSSKKISYQSHLENFSLFSESLLTQKTGNHSNFLYLLQVKQDSLVEISNPGMLDMCIPREQYWMEALWRNDPSIPNGKHLQYDVFKH